MTFCLSELAVRKFGGRKAVVLNFNTAKVELSKPFSVE